MFSLGIEKGHGDLANKYVKEGKSLDDLKDAILTANFAGPHTKALEEMKSTRSSLDEFDVARLMPYAANRNVLQVPAACRAGDRVLGQQGCAAYPVWGHDDP